MLREPHHGPAEPLSAHDAGVPGVARARDQPRESRAPELYAEASPITHVSADDPPAVIIHGTADAAVPYTQAVKLTQRLDEFGVPCEFFTIEGGGHGGHQGLALEQFQAAMIRADAFVNEHLLGE